MRAILSNMLWADDELAGTLCPEKYRCVKEGSPLMGTTDITIDPVYRHEGWTGFPRATAVKEIASRGIAIEDARVLPKAARTFTWNPQWPLRPDQAGVVDSVMAQFNLGLPGSVVVSPVASGKTALALAIAERMQTNVLVLLDRDILIDQWKAETEKFLNVSQTGLMREGTENLQPITFGLMQTVHRRASEEASNYFGLIVVDECVTAGAEKWKDAACRFNAKFRCGLTGTPRTDGLWPIVEGNLGPVVAAVSVPELVPKIYMVPFRSFVPPDLIKSIKRKAANPLSAFDKILSKRKKRNEYIVSQILFALGANRDILVLCDRKDHIFDLATELTTRVPDIKVDYYVGDGPEITGQAVSFGTWSYVNKGLNVPRLDTLIMGSPHGNPIQSVGRILRSNAVKETPTVIDIVDVAIPDLVGLAWSRIRKYGEAGYDVWFYEDAGGTWVQQAPSWLRRG